MQRIQLDVSERSESGKGAARKLRAAGRVPAVAYGSGVAALSLDVDGLELDRIQQSGANVLIDLAGPEAVSGRIALLKEVQRDPVKRSLLHCDFYVIDPEKPIVVSVPLHFEGRPPGVELGGVLEPLIRELEVGCLPLAIPDSISVDVSGLDIGQAVQVGQLELPEGVAATADAERAVVHVVAARVVEEDEPVEDEEAETPEEEAPGEDGEEESS